MAGLASEVNTEQSAEFFRRFGRFGGNMARLRKLLGDDKIMEEWVKGLNQFPEFRLRQSLWTPLAEIIETAKAWPMLFDRFGEKGFKLALEEFQDSPRRQRFEAAQEKHKFLQTVVVPYLANVPETILYARARMMGAFGDKYDEWKEAYAKDVDDKRVCLLPEVTDHKECLRIEVIDFGAHFDPENGFVPQDVRNKDSAHAGVIYAASQNTAWVRAMDGSNVPYALAGGYKLNVPGSREWADLPSVWRDGDQARLGDDWCGLRYRRHALPSLWE